MEFLYNMDRQIEEELGLSIYKQGSHEFGLWEMWEESHRKITIHKILTHTEVDPRTWLTSHGWGIREEIKICYPISRFQESKESEGLIIGIEKSWNPKHLFGWRSWSHQLVAWSGGSCLVLFFIGVTSNKDLWLHVQRFQWELNIHSVSRE